MKKILFFLIFSSHTLHICAQGWAAEYAFGYAKFELDGVRSMQDQVLKSMSQYGVRAVEQFPNNYIHSGSIGYMTRIHHLGMNFLFMTTGGRLNASDYSGTYNMDMIINGFRIGAFYRCYIPIKKFPLNPYFQIGMGGLMSDLEVDEKIHIYNEFNSNHQMFSGKGTYLEMLVGIKYHIYKAINVSIGCGYETDFYGTLKSGVLETGDTAHWNGLRLYGSILISTPNSNRKK